MMNSSVRGCLIPVTFDIAKLHMVETSHVLPPQRFLYA